MTTATIDISMRAPRRQCAAATHRSDHKVLCEREGHQGSRAGEVSTLAPTATPTLTTPATAMRALAPAECIVEPIFLANAHQGWLRRVRCGVQCHTPISAHNCTATPVFTRARPRVGGRPSGECAAATRACDGGGGGCARARVALDKRPMDHHDDIMQRAAVQRFRVAQHGGTIPSVGHRVSGGGTEEAHGCTFEGGGWGWARAPDREGG